MPKLKRQTLADLKLSTIGSKEALRMHIRDITPDKWPEIYNIGCKTMNISAPKSLNDVHGYEIPYLDLKGNHTGFARYKLLGSYVPKGEKRPIKYLQLPGTKPQLYFPPFCDWQIIATDTAIPIYFVEGEKKAAAMAMHGFPTIGLGGIWSWRTREDDETSSLIPDFNLINWKSRKTIIVFDSDV